MLSQWWIQDLPNRDANRIFWPISPQKCLPKIGPRGGDAIVTMQVQQFQKPPVVLSPFTFYGFSQFLWVFAGFLLNFGTIFKQSCKISEDP